MSGTECLLLFEAGSLFCCWLLCMLGQLALSFWGFSCVCLPFLCRKAGITDVFLAHLTSCGLWGTSSGPCTLSTSHVPSLGHILHCPLSHRARAHLQEILPTLRQLKLWYGVNVLRSPVSGGPIHCLQCLSGERTLTPH